MRKRASHFHYLTMGSCSFCSLKPKGVKRQKGLNAKKERIFNVLFFLVREEMTSKVIQWEEDWFSVEAKAVEAKEEVEAVEAVVPVEVVEAVVPVEEVEAVEAVEEKEQDECLYRLHHTQEIEGLRSLLHTQGQLLQRQSEEIDILRQDMKALRQEMKEREKEREKEKEKEVPSITDLFDSWKQWKERELNYALRRRQPVPFFPLESMMRWERAVHPLFGHGSLGPKGSPLFRHQVEKAKQEKELEELLRGMEAVKL